jgi:hypothetical protein
MDAIARMPPSAHSADDSALPLLRRCPSAVAAAGLALIVVILLLLHGQTVADVQPLVLVPILWAPPGRQHRPRRLTYG